MKKASILLKTTPGSRIRLPFLAALACLILESSPAQPITPTVTNEPTPVIEASVDGDSIVLPTGLSDPIEPFNRAIWGFNKGFMTWVVKPASKGYRRVVFKPVRTGIGNMGKNLTFPDRLLNNLLQGKWAGMGQETERCICNTVIGLGGFFDVATRWGIPRSDASFSQTFSKWGWRPWMLSDAAGVWTQRRAGCHRPGRRRGRKPHDLFLPIHVDRFRSEGQ